MNFYMCLPCDLQFYANQDTGTHACPSCRSVGRDDISALHIVNDEEHAEFLAAFDFGEGD